MARSSNVFVSYSWESNDHSDRVLALAETLELLGISVIFDQFDPHPQKPWSKWMNDAVSESDFVLCICTPSYKERVDEQQQAGTGLGCQWEGTLIYNLSASNNEARGKFLPVLFPPAGIESVPVPLLGNNRFLLNSFELQDREFERLYRLLTNQPAVTRPDRGSVVELPTRERPSVPRSGTSTSPIGASIEDQKDSSNLGQKSTPLTINRGGQGDFLKRRAVSLLNKGAWFWNREQWSEAEKQYRLARRMDGSQWLTATINLAGVYMNASRHEDAEREMKSLVDMNPDDLDIQSFWAWVLYYTGQTERALEIADLLESKVKEPFALENLCLLWLGDGQAERVISFLSKLEITNTEASLIRMLGNTYMEQDNFINATKSYRKAIEIDAKSPLLWVEYALSLLKDRRTGLAISAFRTALKLEPNYPRAFVGLAAGYAAMYEPDRAVEYMREAVLRDPSWYQQIKDDSDFDSIRESKSFLDFISEGVPA